MDRSRSATKLARAPHHLVRCHPQVFLNLSKLIPYAGMDLAQQFTVRPSATFACSHSPTGVVSVSMRLDLTTPEQADAKKKAESPREQPAPTTMTQKPQPVCAQPKEQPPQPASAPLPAQPLPAPAPARVVTSAAAPLQPPSPPQPVPPPQAQPQPAPPAPVQAPPPPAVAPPAAPPSKAAAPERNSEETTSLSTPDAVTLLGHGSLAQPVLLLSHLL